MIDYMLQIEISMTDISGWYDYWNKLIQVCIVGGKMTFLRISQNQSWIEQDYALQSFTLSWLWLKGWLIQTVELLIWTTVSIVTADNNYSPLMQPTVQQSMTGIWEMSMWFLSFLKNVRPSLVVLFFFAF